MSNLYLLKNFIKKPIHTGAVWPSSKYLGEMITSNINIEGVDAIAELGPGTGALTKYIAKKKKKDAKLIALELNTELYKFIKNKYPEIQVYNEDASNLKSIIHSNKINGLDIVISGLPWASFSSDLQMSILDAIYSSLKCGGTFTTFAYIQGLLLPSGIRFRKLLSKIFSEVTTTKIIWRNIPPAFIYRCKK